MIELALSLFDKVLYFLQNQTEVSLDTLYKIIVYMILIIFGLFVSNIVIIILKKFNF